MAKIQEKKMGALKAAWKAAKCGLDYSQHLKYLHHLQLLQISEDNHPDINSVRVIANGPGGRVCPACKQLDGKVLNLASELDKPSLPNSSCTCMAHRDAHEGFCLCYYEIVFDDEL